MEFSTDQKVRVKQDCFMLNAGSVLTIDKEGQGNSAKIIEGKSKETVLCRVPSGGSLFVRKDNLEAA